MFHNINNTSEMENEAYNPNLSIGMRFIRLIEAENEVNLDKVNNCKDFHQRKFEETKICFWTFLYFLQLCKAETKQN